MLLRIVFLFAIICSTKAFDLKHLKQVILKYPELQSCIPTLKMFDASGKFPDGLMSGNFVAMGNFDQCLSIDEINNKSETIKGKYCLMKFVVPLEKNSRLPINVYEKNFVLPEPKMEERMILQVVDKFQGIILGWCLPHTCPVDKLSDVLTSILQVAEPEMKIMPVIDGMCQTKDDLVIKYNTSSIIIITFLCATLFLMIISTFYDLYIQHRKIEPAHIILIAFSVKTNVQKLLSVSNHPDQLPCLNGIKFLSMMWIVYAHRFSAIALGSLTNTIYLKDWINNPANMYILNAPVAVDTFFVISGLLVGYVFCLTKDRGAKFNIILFYLHRYIRLTPALAIVIWFHSTIMEFFGSGPFWPFTIMSLKNPCVDHWWALLIYIQNYYKIEETSLVYAHRFSAIALRSFTYIIYLKDCIPQAWYLAVDMQLFILSPIILIPLWRWPKGTLMVCAVLIFGSMVSGFVSTYILDLASFTINFMNSPDSNRYYYLPTHTRFGPWLMGVMLGYYLFRLKKNKINFHNKITLRPSQVVFGWIVSLGLLLSTLFAAHGLMIHPEKLGNSFFNSLHRHGWSLGLCWVIYACTQGYGGPINTFLSCSVFQILARISYSIYLVHLSVQYLIVGSSKTSTYFQDFHLIYGFWGDFMVALPIAVCLTLAYESPMITIEKVIFKTVRKPTKPELPVHQNPSISDGQTNRGFVED